jgi:hypothetical protein
VVDPIDTLLRTAVAQSRLVKILAAGVFTSVPANTELQKEVLALYGQVALLLSLLEDALSAANGAALSEIPVADETAAEAFEKVIH